MPGKTLPELYRSDAGALDPDAFFYVHAPGKPSGQRDQGRKLSDLLTPISAAAAAAAAAQGAANAASSAVAGKADASALAGKADQSALDALGSAVAAKADASAVATVLNNKADNSSVAALSTTVAGKASQSALDALGTVVAAKADAAAVSTALGGKQTASAELGAVSGWSATGMLVRTGAGAYAFRAITAGSSKLTVTNGNGIGGAPTIDVVEDQLTLGNLSGTLPLDKGGTGATTRAAAALAILPDQTGKAGKVLSSDGTVGSWATPTVAWGNISGALNAQIELQAAIDSKANATDAAVATAAAVDAATSRDAAATSAGTASAEADRAATQVDALTQIVKRISGLPIEWITTARTDIAAGAFGLRDKDKFGGIAAARDDISQITLTQGWHTAAADDGRPSMACTRIYNWRASAALPIKVPAASVTPSSVNPTFGYSYRWVSPGGPTDPSAEPAKTDAFDFVAPAGKNRKISIFGLAVHGQRANPTTNQQYINITGITNATNLTKAVADTGSAGYKNLAPQVSGMVWTCDLADSPSTPTTHTVSLSLPAKLWSCQIRGCVFKDTDGLTVAGSNPANGMVFSTAPTIEDKAGAAVFMGLQGYDGGPLDATAGPTGYTAEAPTATSGTDFGADTTAAVLLASGIAAGSPTWTVDWSVGGNRAAFVAYAISSPLPASTAVTIVGVPGGQVDVPAGGAADIEGLSDGTTFVVRLV